MSNLFKKAAVCTDIHWGLKSNSLQHNLDCDQFIDWFTYSPESIDGKSKIKAYALFENSFVDSLEVGTAKGLQQIHAYIFGGLYDFAGQLRTKNIAKGGYRFEYANHLSSTLLKIDTMPETNFDGTP